MNTTSATITVTTKSWTGRNGQTRHYIQNVAEIANHLAGGNLSNAKLSQARAAKIWIDADNDVHVDSYALADFWSFGTDKLVAYIKASMSASSQAATPASAPTSADYDEVASPVYGRGRRYASQSGATQYRGADGSYSVQIWDES